MPVDRLLHPRIGDSEKVSQITDSEFRVWIAYMLAADDFGVLPMLASKIKAADRSLSHRPSPKLEAALEHMVAIGLILRFIAQGAAFVWTPTWQFHQRIRYPRREQTHYPAPPESELEALDSETTAPTRALFATFHMKVSPAFRDRFGDHEVLAKIAEREEKRSRKVAGTKQQRSRDVPGTLPEHSGDVATLTRVGARETALANGQRQSANGSQPTANGSFGEGAETPLPTPARRGPTRGLLRGPDPNAAFDGPKVYVPHKLHEKFLRFRNEDELRRWYEDVSEAWSYGPHADDEPGPDMFKFWEARYAERWPSSDATRATPKTAGNMAAMQRFATNKGGVW